MFLNICLWDIVPEYMAEAGMSKTAFCKKCHISGKTLERILARDQKLSTSYIIKIAKAIGIDAKLFFRSIEINEEDDAKQ